MSEMLLLFKKAVDGLNRSRKGECVLIVLPDVKQVERFKMDVMAYSVSNGKKWCRDAHWNVQAPNGGFLKIIPMTFYKHTQSKLRGLRVIETNVPLDPFIRTLMVGT